MLNSPALLEFSRWRAVRLPLHTALSCRQQLLNSWTTGSQRAYGIQGFSSRHRFNVHKINHLKKPHESSALLRYHGTQVDRERAKKLTVIFVDKHGQEKVVSACHGENVLELAHDNEIELEGACEGGLACSTCHVIIDTEENCEKFTPPSIREEDLLDIAPGLSETSRLCCQLYLDADKHDGITFKLPKTTRNFYVDGFVSKPH